MSGPNFKSMHGKYQHQRSYFLVCENVEIGYDFPEEITDPIQVARELHVQEEPLFCFHVFGLLVLAV